MSADEIAYGEQLPVPRRRGPAFGDARPLPRVEEKEEPRGPLDRRTEAILALAILTPVVATYGAISYGLYALVNSSF
jgi:hypothetical protein